MQFSQAKFGIPKRGPGLLLLALLVVTAAVGVAARGEDRPGKAEGEAEAEPDAGEPVHADPAGVERAVLDAALAFTREDARAARLALDRLSAGVRQLLPEEEEPFGSTLVNYSRAFRITLDRARELAGKGDVDASFDQFIWAQRTCRICHRFARDEGLLPPLPTRE